MSLTPDISDNLSQGRMPPAPPLVWFCLSSLLGAAIYPANAQSPQLWWWTLGVGSLLVAIYCAKRIFIPRCLLAVSGCIFGAWISWTPPMQPQLIDCSVRVQRVLWASRSQGLLVDIQQTHAPTTEPRLQRVVAVTPSIPAVLPGDHIRLRGILEQHEYRGKPRWRLRAIESEWEYGREESHRGFAWQAINRLGSSQQLAAALTIGSGGPRERPFFRDAGLMHILAVSGLHVGLALMGVWFLLRVFRTPYPWTDIITACAGGGYLWLTHAALPTQRAVVMIWAVLAGRSLARQLHPLATVSLAGMILIIIHPGEARSLGFQLSVGAVIGIMTLGRDLVRFTAHARCLQPWPSTARPGADFYPLHAGAAKGSWLV